MKELKIKSDEVFKLIIVDDNGNEMMSKGYYFDSYSKITYTRSNAHDFTLVRESELFMPKKIKP